MSWFKNAIANLYDLVSAPVDSKGVTLALFMGGVALKLCGEWKTNNAMTKAAKGGHVEIVKLCKEGEQQILMRLWKRQLGKVM